MKKSLSIIFILCISMGLGFYALWSWHENLTTVTREHSDIDDMLRVLHQSRIMFEEETLKKATGFEDFVVFDKTDYAKPMLPMYNFGRTDKEPCRMDGKDILCPDVFEMYKNVRFYWPKDGTSRCSAEPVGSSTKACRRPIYPSSSY